ncbi:head maturation protease, ClpP-related [Hoeflea sp.]|uniref:head maturation protease, ClpP-related n=1 Tax=Hoeflea sp. TaxID=1940281 RepID=UPI003A9533C7
MSLKKLPEIKAERLPKICAFEPDPDALDKWNAGVKAVQSGDNTITVLDVIGEDPWTGGGVTSKRVAAALRAIGDREIYVDINSPGGDFFEGVAIYEMLRNHPAKVTVRILGLAASAASIIAMAGDEIQIGKASAMMVHRVSVLAIGNRNDFLSAVETMDKFDEGMAALYAARTGVDHDEAVGWIDRETWFNGEQAVNAGLADSFLPADVVEEDEAKAENARSVNATRRVDALLAKAGISRNERRSLIGEVKGGTHDAAATATHDAGELKASLSRLVETLKL